MFLGLALGWKYEKIGGYLIAVPFVISIILMPFFKTGFPAHMLVPFMIGILYLIVGYNKAIQVEKNSETKDKNNEKIKV